jgi:hypothetical protein
LTACLDKTVLSEKMIEEDLSRVEQSATKSTYKLGVGFERCEDKGEKSAPMFIPSFTYHQEEKTIKSTKPQYPSNPKPSFNPKGEVRKETPKPREEAFVCIFCGYAGHLDEFCFRQNRIEKKRFEYVLAVLKPNRIIRKHTDANCSSFHPRVLLGLSNLQGQRQTSTISIPCDNFGERKAKFNLEMSRTTQMQL